MTYLVGQFDAVRTSTAATHLVFKPAFRSFWGFLECRIIVIALDEGLRIILTA